MRRCGICKKELSLELFAWRSEAKGTLQANCRICQKAYRKDHYEANIDKYKKRVAERNRTLRFEHNVLLIKYLEAHPCIDCGETDPIVLEFDHLRDKKNDVSKMVGRSNWLAVLKEIEKCEVVCANCHRRRTAIRGGWQKAMPVKC